MLAALTLLLMLAHAEPRLRVPVFVTSDYGPVPVHLLNQKVAAFAPNPRVPEWIELSENVLSKVRVDLVDANIELARRMVGGAFRNAERVFEYAPGDLRAPGFETCYVGDPSIVSDFVNSLGDYFYSEHLSVWGWRYRSKTVVYYDEDREYLERHSPELWRSNPRDDSLLLLTRVLPDGRDIHVTRIKKCE